MKLSLVLIGAALLVLVLVTPSSAGAQDTTVIPGSEVDNLQAIAAYKAAISHNQEKYSRLPKDSPELVALAAKLAKSYEGLGVAYIRSGQYSEAIPPLTNAITLSADNLNAIYSRAVAYNRSGKSSEAIADFKKLLSLKDDPLYREELAVAYVNVGDKDAAIAQYETLLRGRPNDAWYNFQVGYLYAEKGSYAKAAQAYEKAVANGSQLAQSTLATAHNNLGDAYFHLCNRDKSIAAYKKAAEMNPEYNEGLGAAYLLRCP